MRKYRSDTINYREERIRNLGKSKEAKKLQEDWDAWMVDYLTRPAEEVEDKELFKGGENAYPTGLFDRISRIEETLNRIEKSLCQLIPKGMPDSLRDGRKELKGTCDEIPARLLRLMEDE